MADTRQPRRPRGPTPDSHRADSDNRATTGTSSPPRSADDAEIIDLINNVRSVRITLSADLSVAAGAVEAGQLEIARDILSADQDELAGFAAASKQALAATAVAPAVPGPRQPRRPRTRLLLALPAIPLVGAVAMTAAAALGGAVQIEHHPSGANAHQRPAIVESVPRSITPIAAPTADSTLLRLEHVVTHHPKEAQVLAVANDLHQQLAQMISSSKDNPQQLGVVRRLLNLEQRVLEGNNAPGSTVALAASREIAQLLSRLPTPKSTKPATAATPRTPSPTAPAATTPAPTSTPKTPTVGTAPTVTKHHPHATPSASHKPKKPKKWFDPLHFPNVFADNL